MNTFHFFGRRLPLAAWERSHCLPEPQNKSKILMKSICDVDFLEKPNGTLGIYDRMDDSENPYNWSNNLSDRRWIDERILLVERVE